MSQYIAYLDSHDQKWSADCTSFYGQPVDIWSVGMVFSELLLRACGGQLPHLYAKFQLSQIDPKLSERRQFAEEQRQRLNFILQEIGLQNLKNTVTTLPGAPPLHDLPVAVELLDRMLHRDWQGENARISAKDALSHSFFGSTASEQAVPLSDEKIRFKEVQVELQRLQKVREWKRLCLC
jgi:serine/threonine protein kinase